MWQKFARDRLRHWGDDNIVARREKIRDFFIKLSIAGEFIVFLWKRKLFWMIPIVAMLLLVGFLLVLTESSAIAPFIYAMF